MTDQELEQRAARAKALLEDPVLGEALTAIHAAAMSQWSNTKAADTLVREYAWFQVKAIEQLRAQIASFADDLAVRKFNAKAK